MPSTPAQDESPNIGNSQGDVVMMNEDEIGS